MKCINESDGTPSLFATYDVQVMGCVVTVGDGEFGL